jgi:hypothetical protein
MHGYSFTMQTPRTVLLLRKTWSALMYDVGQLAVALLLPFMFLTPLYWYSIKDLVPRLDDYDDHASIILLWFFLLIVTVLLLWLVSVTFGRRMAGRPDLIISASGIEAGFWFGDHRSWEALGEAVIEKRSSRARGLWADCVVIPGSERARIVGTDVVILDDYNLSPSAMIDEINKIRTSPKSGDAAIITLADYRDRSLRYSARLFGSLLLALVIWLQFGRALIG